VLVFVTVLYVVWLCIYMASWGCGASAHAVTGWWLVVAVWAVSGPVLCGVLCGQQLLRGTSPCLMQMLACVALLPCSFHPSSLVAFRQPAALFGDAAGCITALCVQLTACMPCASCNCMLLDRQGLVCASIALWQMEWCAVLCVIAKVLYRSVLACHTATRAISLCCMFGVQYSGVA
jgi:hypothetical protein